MPIGRANRRYRSQDQKSTIREVPSLMTVPCLNPDPTYCKPPDGGSTADHHRPELLSVGSVGQRLSTVTAAVSKRLIGTHENIRKMGLTQLLYITGLVIFTCFGGIIFRWLDKTAGESAIHAYKKRCLSIISETYEDLLQNCSNGSFDSCQERIFEALLKIDRCHKNCTKNCSKVPSLPMSDLGNAIIFASTTYTTIGYGSIYPTTDLCKAATIIYTFIGIPYFLALLQAIGRWLRMLFTKFWNWTRRNLIKGFRQNKVSRSSIESRESKTKARHFRWFPLLIGFCVSIFYLCVVAVAFQIMLEEPLSYFDSFYFIVQSVTLVGFGDIFPKNSKVVLYHSFSILFGICLMSMCFFILQESLMDRATVATERVSAGVQVLGRKVSRDIVGPFNERIAGISLKRNLSFHSRGEGQNNNRKKLSPEKGCLDLNKRRRTRSASIDVTVNPNTGSSFILGGLSGSKGGLMVRGSHGFKHRMRMFGSSKWRSIAEQTGTGSDSGEEEEEEPAISRNSSRVSFRDSDNHGAPKFHTLKVPKEEVNGFIMLSNKETYL